MMRAAFFFIGVFYWATTFAQTEQLNRALIQMERDAQYAHASIALLVKEVETGKVVFEKNRSLGVIPASSLKVLTSVTAFDVLGSDFRFKTNFVVAPSFQNGKTALYITGWGDPSTGSSRWEATRPQRLLEEIFQYLKDEGINQLDGGIFLDDLRMGYQSVPDGWLYEDFGNYFGAGHYGINWQENIFEIDLKGGQQPGSAVEILNTRPADIKPSLVNDLQTGNAGSGDQTIVYGQPYGNHYFISGKAGAGEKITVKGAHADPAAWLGAEISAYLSGKGVSVETVQTFSGLLRQSKSFEVVDLQKSKTLYSPTWHLLNREFMHKSINLYGEAVVRQIALQQKAFTPATREGIALVREHWSCKGIGQNALQIVDGSGLSPVNRITVEALVKVMEYAKGKPWFNLFLDGLPEMNGMKLKSGYMKGVRSYTGMVPSRTGKKYWVSFVVNNFSGSASQVRKRMWQVLDVLK